MNPFKSFYTKLKVMSFEERNDFFVERKQLIIEITKEPINLIFAKIKDNDIDSEECDFMPSNDHRIGINISRVRIPSLVFLKDKVQQLLEYTKLFKKYRKQVGAHLFIDFEGKLGVIKTYLDDRNKYHVSKAKFINEVYPCFTFVGEEYQMCIGLRFSADLKDGVRSFGKTADKQRPSGGVYDLTESFLDPLRIKTGIESKENRNLFPRGQQHYAIYLCCGARLIVEDDRYDVLTEKAETKVGVHQNRSLFQSGSLLIFSAELLLEVSIGIKNETIGRKNVKKVIYEWRDAEKAGILKPEKGIYQDWFTERRLHQSNEQVIFLGHNYSVHNSICWRIKIQSPKTNSKGQIYARLSAPEGGRIVDIQDWDWGMAEIYWRHRYERLYEKVLFPNKPEKFVQKPDFSFKLPDIGGENPYYWQKKIFGVGVNFNSWTLRLQYEYDDQKSVIVPPYFDQFTQMVDGVNAFPQPLYPPIYSEDKYLYLPYKTRPNFIDDQSVEINGQKYRIGFKENVDEYRWADPIRVSLHPNKELSAEYRIGVDLMVYTKHNSVIGKKILIYFELSSNENIDSKEKQKSSEKAEKKSIDSVDLKLEKSESIEKTFQQNLNNQSKDNEEKKDSTDESQSSGQQTSLDSK